MAKTSFLRAYPEGSFYGNLLHWHLLEHGTRPDGTTQKWEIPLFAMRVYQNKEIDENNTRSLKNWIRIENTNKSFPPIHFDQAKKIQELLFFDKKNNLWNPDLEKWADQLWNARKNHYKNRIGDKYYKNNLIFVPERKSDSEQWTKIGVDPESLDVTSQSITTLNTAVLVSAAWQAKTTIKGKISLSAGRFSPLAKSFVEHVGVNSQNSTEVPIEKMEPFDPKLKTYLEKLAQKFGKLPLHGIRESNGIEIELEKVYVALSAVNADFALRERLHEAEVLDRAKVASFDAIPGEQLDDYDAEVVRATYRSKRDVQEDGIHHSVGELFRLHRRLVILGAPGSGKSTVGRWIALQSARGVLKELETREPVRIEVPRKQLGLNHADELGDDVKVDLGPARIPIFLSVTHYARALAESDSTRKADKGLIQYLGRDQDTEELNDGLSADERNACFMQHVYDGRAVIILDGLDELPDRNRRAVVPKIHDFIDEHIPTKNAPPHEIGGNQIIITSRLVGYELASVRHGSMHFRIEPMTRTAVEWFAHSWGAAVNAQLKTTGDRLFESGLLIAEIYDRKRPKVQELARNPLLVTILATVFYRHKTLPEFRAELYHRMIVNLLEIWLKRDECARHTLRDYELLAALQPLAADMQQNASRNGIVGIGRITEIIGPVLAELRNKKVDSPSFIGLLKDLRSTIATKVGLLAEQSTDNYQFFHGTFREFLAGRHLIANKAEAASRICQHLDDSRWREPILLALGFAMSNEEWDTADRERLLSEMLAADRDGGLIPRATLTVMSAFSEMPDLPAAIITKIVAQLCLSYARCLEPATGDRLQLEIHSALQRLRATPYVKIVEATLLSSLHSNEHRASTATLLFRLDWFSVDLVEGLLSEITNDYPNLNWPIRRSLLRGFTEEAQVASRTNLALNPRIFRLLPMRERLLREPESVAWLLSESAWLWLIIALYGGVPQPFVDVSSENAASNKFTESETCQTDSERLTFNPRCIVSDLHDQKLSRLLSDAFIERRPARSLLQGLNEMWRQDNPLCDGEVLVAMAALGSDVVPIIQASLGRSDHGRRAKAAISRLMWVGQWLRPTLHQNGHLGLRTLPTVASERNRLHLLGGAVDILLCVGVAPQILLPAMSDRMIDTATDQGRTELYAERLACHFIAKPHRLSGGSAESEINLADMPAAWALLPQTGALRNKLLRSRTLPIHMDGRSALQDAYVTMLRTAAMLPVTCNEFASGKQLGRYHGAIQHDPALLWATANLVLSRSSEFGAGFQFGVGHLQISDTAVIVLKSILPKTAIDIIELFRQRTYQSASAFVGELKEKLNDNWKSFGAHVLFWAAPGLLNDNNIISANDLGGMTFTEFPVSENGFRKSSSDIANIIYRNGQLSKTARDEPQYITYFDEALDWEGGDTLSKIEQIADESMRTELIREKRTIFAHDPTILESLNLAASRIWDPWLRARALERTSRLIQHHQNDFESGILIWQINRELSANVTFRSRTPVGKLVWGALYLYAVSNEVSPLIDIKSSTEDAWRSLHGPDPERAVEELAASGVRDGIKLGIREALSLERLIAEDRLDHLDELWPVLEATPEIVPVIVRWSEGNGPAAQWARLTLAEGGHLDSSTVSAALEFLDHSDDRLRLRAQLALHSNEPHLSTHKPRWSVKTAGADALELVARKACAQDCKASQRTTMSWVFLDVQHDNADAMARWIERARNESASSASNWLLRHVDRADQSVLDVMLKGILNPESPPTLQLNLLRGLCRSLYREGNVVLSELSALSTIPLDIRRSYAPIPDGAAVAIKTCVLFQDILGADERLRRAREHFDGQAVWLDDDSFSESKNLNTRLGKIGHADFIWLESYWANAETEVKSIKNLKNSIEFIFSWLNEERLPPYNEHVITHLLTAIDTLAAQSEEEIVAAVADPEHWEPILAEWAEFFPWWPGRQAAISLLGRLRRITSRTAPALVSALQDVNYVQLAAFKASQRFRSVDGDVLSTILGMLDSKSAATTASAAHLLSSLCKIGEGEFLDHSQVFRCLQEAASQATPRGVYLQLDPTNDLMGFNYVDRIDQLLRNAALAVGRF